MEKRRIDLHTHSLCSDGTLSPRELVFAAAEAGIGLMALSDHDTVLGVPEALAAGREAGVTVVPAVEFDTEFPEELHILGYCIDWEEPRVKEGLRQCIERRERRNEEMLKKLLLAGYDIRRNIANCRGSVTRANFASALLEDGYVQSFEEGIKLVIKGGIGYASAVRHTPEHVIELITGSGGLPVLAHPCHLKRDVFPLARELKGYGLQGIEAYYGTATPGQTKRDISLAEQMGLFVTCGSDFHGVGKSHAPLGSAWQDTERLQQTGEMLRHRLGR